MNRIKVFPDGNEARNEITKLILANPRVSHDLSSNTMVFAIKSELLVRRSVLDANPVLAKRLGALADRVGSLGFTGRPCTPANPVAGVPPVDSEGQSAVEGDLALDLESAAGDDPAQDGESAAEGDRGSGSAKAPAPTVPADVELWRITDPELDSIDVARELRVLVYKDPPADRRPAVEPAVSPNHVTVLCVDLDSCPATPQMPPAPPLPQEAQFFPQRAEPYVQIVLIDSGYFRGVHSLLDPRVSSVQGTWLNTTTGVWGSDPPDALDWSNPGPPVLLDGVAGHGTFNAGVIARACPNAAITVVGSRHDIVPIDGPADLTGGGLCSTEFDIANAVWASAQSDPAVISCGFAFPSLDDYRSISFNSVMESLRASAAPRSGIAVVAPAGNEGSPSPYWPSALPTVIGVASTDATDKVPATFSNWGTWCDCCARGEDVVSTYVNCDLPVQNATAAGPQLFEGWANWSGTSFAAPKVAAAIAVRVAATGETPVAAYAALEAGAPTVAGTIPGAVGDKLAHLIVP